MNMFKEIHKALFLEVNPVIHLGMDSTAAAAFSMRRGPGAMKHIQIKFMSLQDDVGNEEVTISYVPTDELVADYLTKPVTVQKLDQFKMYIGLRTTVRTELIALEPAMGDHEICALWDTAEPRDLEPQQDYSVLNLILVLAVCGLCYIVRDIVQYFRAKRQARARELATVPYPLATPQNRGQAARRR